MNFSFGEIGKRFGILITDAEKDPSVFDRCDKDCFMNRSYIVGSGEIILGIYEDDMLKVASFFHEIGHTLINQEYMKGVNYKSYLIEQKAWELGFDLAKEYDIQFDNYIHVWAEKQAQSYL